MSDATGPLGSNGAAGASLGDDLKRELDNGDATPKDMAVSPSGDVSSEKAATMAKAKTIRPRTAPKAAGAQPAARASATKAPGARAAAARPEPSLSEDDSVLIAGIDRAEAEAARLRAWARIRREKAREAIRTHPLGSSVMVFAAGMIFGLLLARR